MIFSAKRIFLCALIISFCAYFFYENQWSIKRHLGLVPSVKTSKYYLAQEAWLNSLQSLNIKPEIVFIGDSISCNGSWHNYFPQNKICNLGMRGDVSFNVSYRAKVIKNWNPKKVFIIVGINDLSRKINPVSNFSRNYQEMLKNISENNPTSQIYCVSILPIAEKGFSKNRLILDANKEISKIVKNFSNVKFVNIHKDFCDSNGKMSAEYSKDGVHPNTKGYSIFSNLLSPYIK